MSNLKWRYTKVKGGVKQGINFAGIEGFAGNRIGSLTREICQNSLDAKSPELTNKPVVIKFKEFKMNRNQFPDIESLIASLNKIKEESRGRKDQKTFIRTKNAIDLMNLEYINFIRISDYNTVGLTGISSFDTTPWNNLVKSQGISDKDGSAGGSFGIGKNASFAVSDINTVFYSTLNNEGEKATMGVANLASYNLEEEGTHTQGTEFLATDDKHTPLLELIEFENGYIRNDVGTDIYIAGFIQTENNERKIIQEVLNNYLYAIFEESLVVEVNSEIIEKENLAQLLQKYKDSLDIQTLELYKLLTEENVKVYNERILETDDIELRFMVDQEGSNTTSMIRKPWMKVYYENRSKRHFTFFGACLIKGKKLNELLRKAENPQHDKWEEDRSSENKIEIKKVLRDIRNLILIRLEELHEVPIEEFTDIFGAGEYIPMDNSGDQTVQAKVTDKVLEISIKDIPTQIETKMINEYEDEGDFIIDLDGNVDVEVVHPPTKDENQGTSPNVSTTTKSRGERIGVDKRALRIIKFGNEIGKYVIIFDSIKEYNNTIIQVDALDEQGLVIKNALNILFAEKENQSYGTKDNRILNVPISYGSNRIIIKTDLKINIGIGVSIYDN